MEDYNEALQSLRKRISRDPIGPLPPRPPSPPLPPPPPPLSPIRLDNFSGRRELLKSGVKDFDEALNRLREGISRDKARLPTASEYDVVLPPPPPLPRYPNDVFLSFRGEDTRSSFISHLYSSLTNAGIEVFKDDETLSKGDQITSLLQEIENSRISIVVLSRNYANSIWCLLELEKIMNCHTSMAQVVLPVFVGVDPSEVRHQNGNFGEAFDDLINRMSVTEDQVLRWMTSLYQVGGMSGFVVMNSSNESKDIEDILEHVCTILDKTNLFVADHPVGVTSRVEEVIQLLNSHPSDDVVLVGIWGMGGIGKTTIAKAIYNETGRNFEGRSFLANIREVWEQDNGQVALQQRLLSDIYKTTKIKINSIELGKSIMKERLRHRRILLILDDVNKLDQINALSASREWFRRGSRIFITTRDEHILKVLKVDYVCRMKEMDENESFELFSWHAFKQATPKEDFTELSRNVVAYSRGLPVALEVLGCYLFNRGILEWKSVLEKLKRIPNDQIQKKLKISFDGLEYLEKDIFLDISCFFIGMDRYVATHILNECGFFADIGISVLVERSLVTVDNKNKLGMHDLLRDMGREIIREMSPNVVEDRSRLWYHDDVLDVLSKRTGTKFTEGLGLKLPRTNTICLSTKAFHKMERLRLLQLGHVQLEGDYEHLSKNLKWLCWQGFPLRYMPSNYYQKSLVAIELKYSNLKILWKNPEMLENLKVLNLSHSHYLTQTPDFSNLPNLERLILKDCSSLRVVHYTIGDLTKLILLNLKDCKFLPNLPKSIYKSKSLKTLILSGCSNIEKLEDDIEQMESLTTLVADNTSITQVPFSIARSKSIGYISLCGFEGLSRDVFPSLIWSWMSPKNTPLSLLIQPFESMSSLVSINVPNSSFHVGISSIMNEVPKLRSLCVECGSNSQLIQDVERILNALYVANCKQFETFQSSTSSSLISASGMETLAITDCCSQVHIISASQSSLRCLLIQMGRKDQVTSTLTNSILQTLKTSGLDDCCLPGDKHPDWLSFSGEGPSAIFEVPQVISGCNLKRMTLCVVYLSSGNSITCEHLNNVLVINYTKTTRQARLH